MASLIPQDRKEIRGSVGRNLKAVYFGTCTSNGNTTTWVDSLLENSNDYINGQWWLGTSSPNDGEERIVDDYVGATTTGTIRGDALSSTADGNTYELLEQWLRPLDLHDYINQAIRAVPRKGAPDYTDESVHTARDLQRYSIPSTFVGIKAVEYLEGEDGRIIEECDDDWDEQTVSGVTRTLDDEDKMHGGASVRLQTTSIGTNTILASEVIDEDLSKFTHLDFWMKSTVATSAGDLTIRLSSSANAASATDDLQVPALTANTWKRCRVALGNPHLDTAIISIGVRQVTDLADAYFWIDQVRAVRAETGTWKPVNPIHWKIDSYARELDFTRGAPQYNWLRLIGAQEPTELTSDTTDCDIDPAYIIAQATAIAMRANTDRFSDGDISIHTREAERRCARMQTPQGMRWIDG